MQFARSGVPERRSGALQCLTRCVALGACCFRPAGPGHRRETGKPFIRRGFPGLFHCFSAMVRSRLCFTFQCFRHLCIGPTLTLPRWRAGPSSHRFAVRPRKRERVIRARVRLPLPFTGEGRGEGGGAASGRCVFYAGWRARGWRVPRHVVIPRPWAAGVKRADVARGSRRAGASLSARATSSRLDRLCAGRKSSTWGRMARMPRDFGSNPA